MHGRQVTSTTESYPQFLKAYGVFLPLFSWDGPWGPMDTTGNSTTELSLIIPTLKKKKCYLKVSSALSVHRP